MATVVVLADPPREGLVLSRLAETSPLSPAETAELYASMLRDVVVAAEESGGDALVNYRPDDLLPGADRGEEEDAEAAVRSALADALEEPDEIRFEPQVGSTPSARLGNTVTHLLEREDASSVVVLDPAAPLVARTAVDEVAMKLRRDEVVLGPAPGGRVALTAFAEPVDFEEALAPPALETLTGRAVDAGLGVGFRGVEPVVETAADLATVVSVLRARRAAGRIVPAFTAETVRDLGLAVDADGAAATVTRSTDND